MYLKKLVLCYKIPFKKVALPADQYRQNKESRFLGETAKWLNTHDDIGIWYSSGCLGRFIS